MFLYCFARLYIRSEEIVWFQDDFALHVNYTEPEAIFEQDQF